MGGLGLFTGVVGGLLDRLVGGGGSLSLNNHQFLLHMSEIVRCHLPSLHQPPGLFLLSFLLLLSPLGSNDRCCVRDSSLNTSIAIHTHTASPTPTLTPCLTTTSPPSTRLLLLLLLLNLLLLLCPILCSKITGGNILVCFGAEMS